MTRRHSFTIDDFGLKATGLALAGLSATFAFDTATQSERYGPPVMQFERLERTADLVDDMQRQQAGLATLRPISDEQMIASSDSTIDTTITGSIAPSDGFDGETETPGGTSETLLLFSAKGRALLSFNGRMVIAAPGSRLPDGDVIQHIGTNTVTTRTGRTFKKTKPAS